MAESKTVTIIPLNGSNFPTWKLQCKMALIRDGVWSIVNVTETTPEVDSDGYSKFCLRRDRALATIVLSIDPSLVYLIGDPEDLVVVWKKLGEKFQKKTWANKLQLRQRLHSLRLREDDAVQKHIKDITEIFNELSIVGDEITDEDRVVYLLASLPDSYNTLVTAFEANGTVPSMETMIERLLHEEKKRSDRGTSNVKGAAMTTRHRYKGKGPRCYNCQKFGHIQHNCPQDLKTKRTDERSHKSTLPGVKPHKVNQVQANMIDSDPEVC